MITLANVNLVLPNREILTDIGRDISVDKMLLLFSRAWPGPGMGFLAMPTHYRRWPPWDRSKSIINRFYWPTGASRWGCGCFLATKDNCERISEACFGQDGTETNKVNLTLSTEDAKDVTIEKVSVDFITVFPPIPLYRVVQDDGSSDHGLYLLLCVDDRYHWWNLPCPDFKINEKSNVTWQDLLDKLGDVIEADINVDGDIPAKYLAPHRALNLTNEPIPPILDAIAYNLGARIVVDYNGDIFMQRFQQALDKFKGDIDQDKHQQIKTLGGDFRFPDLY